MEKNSIKVLVSDDSILVRKKLKDSLMSMGISEIYEATDGQEAIDFYKKYSPDVIFMDIVMPVKNGLEALIEIMNIDAHAKVVIASSTVTKSHLKEAVKAGAYEFIQKPIEDDKLKQIIENVIKGGR